MTPAVSLQQVTKRFSATGGQPVNALSEVDLEIEQGEVFGLLGPNGAGKSTALWILMGMLAPTAGRARILGRPAGASDAFKRLGFLPENFGFHHHQTPEQLCALYARLIGGADWEPIFESGRGWVARFGLAGKWRSRLREFSKGMLQKMGLVQAVMHSPAVILLDEPSANLDPQGRRLVRDVIAESRDRGCAVVVSSHILSEIEAVCDRVGILDRGLLRGNFQIGDLLERQNRWAVDAGPLSEQTRESLKRQNLEIEDSPDGCRVFAPKEEIWNLLDRLRTDGAELQAVNPVRRSLEDAYLGLVDGGGEVERP